MATWTGFFTNSGSPSIKVHLSGIIVGAETEFEALVDTGFDGFISIPLVAAFPLGLPLFGTSSFVLADGSESYRLTAYAKARVGTDEQHGVVVLETGNAGVLLGMEFLRTFRKRLIVCPVNGVLFEDA